MTLKELAAETGIAERYAREWLSHRAASDYLDYDPAPGAFLRTATAPSICKPHSASRSRSRKSQAKVEPVFQTGQGVSWGEGPQSHRDAFQSGS